MLSHCVHLYGHSYPAFVVWGVRLGARLQRKRPFPPRVRLTRRKRDNRVRAPRAELRVRCSKLELLSDNWEGRKLLDSNKFFRHWVDYSLFFLDVASDMVCQGFGISFFYIFFLRMVILFGLSMRSVPRPNELLTSDSGLVYARGCHSNNCFSRIWFAIELSSRVQYSCAD